MKKARILIILMAVYSQFSNAAVPTWSVTPSSFTFSMNVTTKLNVNCVDLTQPNNMVAAFVGGVVRGVSNSSNVVNGNFLAFLTVYSNTVSGEIVTFKIYDATLDSVYNVVTQITFQDGAAFGFPTTPFSVNTNNAPTDIAITNANADENVNQVFIGKFSSTDIDVGQTFTYSLVAGTGSTDNGVFAISNDSLFANTILDFETKQNYSVRISTSDGSCIFEKIFAISVNDMNDLPTDITLNNNAIDENSLLGTLIGSFFTIDPDVNDTHNYTLVAGTGDTHNGMVTLASNGTLTVGSALNHEINDTLFIRIKSVDQGNKAIEKAFFVLVNDLNETPTNIVLSTDTFMENLSLGTIALTFSTIDEDINDAHNYSFDNNISSDNGQFTLIGNTLRTNAAFDFEVKSFYTIAITTQDLGGLSFSRQFILTVADSNDVPTDIAISNASIFEADPIGSFVGKYTTTDEDAVDIHHYTLVAGTGSADNASFTISNDTLLSNTIFNFNTKKKYFIRVQSTDTGNLFVQKTFEIFVKNSNGAPTDITMTSNVIAENLASATFITNLFTADPDSGDGHTYSLVAGTGATNNASFSITNGQLLTNTVFDFEVKNTFSIRLQTQDIAGLTFEKAFTIVITDANDAPTNIVLNTDTFNENLPLNTSIITFSTTDQDTLDAHVYSFDNSVASNNSQFLIVGNSLRTNASFNFEVNSFYAIRITTTDLAGSSLTQQFILTVADSNDAPTDINLSSNTVLENANNGTFVGVLSSTDEDAVDSYHYSLVSGTGATGNGSFMLSNDSLFTNTTFNYNQQNLYSIRIQTSDTGNLTYQKILSITIVNTNDAPTNITLTSNTIAENLASGTFITNMNTVDQDSSDTHTYSLVAGTGDNDNALFSITSNQLLTNSIFDFEVKDTFLIRLQTKDSGDSTFQKAFTIIITDANDAPTDIVLSTDTIDENVALNIPLITLSSIDQDTSDTHSYSFDNTQTNDNASFLIIGNELRSNATINFETKNLYIVHLITNDGQGGTFTKQILLYVRDLNDAPTAQALSNNAVAENNATLTYIGKFSTTDEDTNDSFTYSLISGTGADDNATFTIVGDSLKVIDTLNFEVKNSYTILVKSTDMGGLSVNQQYAINVTDANDVPTALAIDNNIIAENNAKKAVVGNFETTDEDVNDIFTYSLISGTGDDNNNKFIIDASQLKLKKSTDFEIQNSYSVLVQTNDGNGGLTQQTFTISITNVNEAPILDAATFEISENANVNDSVGVFTFSDEDFGDTHTFRVLNNNTFSIDANNNLVLNQLLNYETTPSYTISVEIMDAGGLADTTQFIINVLNVIEFNAALPVNKIMSPNADGKNDYFWIDNVSVYADYSLSIFNNAGKIIFETPSNYDNSWNGKYNNSFVKSGVYYYLLRNKIDKTKYFKGTISIIR